jgi:hypothetical protein
MKKYILILCIASISLLFACNKDKDKEENTPIEKDYYDILGEGTGWSYFQNIRLVSPLWGILYDLDFSPIELKAYGDKFEFYTQERVLSQQGDVYSFKIFTMDIVNPSKPIESIFNYDVSDDIDIKNGFLIINETPDYFLTTTTYNGYNFHMGISNKNREPVYSKEVFENDLFPEEDEFIYTNDKRLFLMGTTVRGCEFKFNNYDGIEILNSIADSAMAMKSFFYEKRAELQELFVSENGYLTAAVMRKEIYHYAQHNTKMISVGCTKTVQCDSSALIDYSKRTDGKYYVTIYSGKDSKLSQYIYDPEFYTFEKVYENRSVPDNLYAIDITTTGKVYMQNLDKLYQTNANSYTEIPLAIFKPKIEVPANISVIRLVVRRDRLFALVKVETGYPYPPQLSIIEYTGK